MELDTYVKHIKIVGFGHRHFSMPEPQLRSTYRCKLRYQIKKRLELYVDTYENVVCYQGGATGFDEDFAMATMSLGVPLVSVLPFPGYNKKFDNLDLHRKILDYSSEVIYTSKTFYKGVYLERNKLMVGTDSKFALVYIDTTRHSGSLNSLNHFLKYQPRTNIINYKDEIFSNWRRN